MTGACDEPHTDRRMLDFRLRGGQLNARDRVLSRFHLDGQRMLAMLSGTIKAHQPAAFGLVLIRRVLLAGAKKIEQWILTLFSFCSIVDEIPRGAGPALDSAPVSRMQRFEKANRSQNPPADIVFFLFFQIRSRLRSGGLCLEHHFATCCLARISKRIIWPTKPFTDVEALDRAIHAAVDTLNIERNVNPLVQQRISA